ncbi:metal-binding protein [Leptolyngbya sp. 'hensonii']|uniref:SWIM zinc finger family protein n=1 Tax=Leptolyngbya sp. 'hensonii' TaxID=1922337 RepID=UPI00094F83FE|nr:SWIM zinc finger family protein [Leptolyngbya sp. 'hensonii']OLP19795.1 metal-binding protein [Leptolyngbya sp. 'hensonii']
MTQSPLSDHGDKGSREWWAQRWIDVLESFGWRRRLERARIYAREGHVLSLEFQGSKVFALVQGTAAEPYKVSLSLDPFSQEQWQYVIETMGQRAIFSAKLLAGEMPQNIEEVFTANGLSLFPFTKFDIHSRCSCPDPANPCKHIGAVYYVLGDRFSEDPFVLFQLRGHTKEQIITALRQLRSTETSEPEDVLTVQPAALSAQSLPTPLKLDQFWDYSDQLEPSLVVIAPPPTTETVLDTLGPIPVKAESPGASASQTALVMEYLQGIYRDASQQAVLTAMTTDG